MKKPSFIVVDVETTGLDWKTDRLHGVGVALEEDDTFYDTVVSKRVKDLLEDPAIANVGHNLRFDVRFLKAAGVNVQGPWHDTKLMAKALNEHQPLGLKDLSLAYKISDLEAKNELDKCLHKLKLKHVGQLCELDLKEGEGRYSDLIGRYCEEDCNNTLKLFLVLRDKLREKDAVFKERFGLKKTPLDAYREEIAPLEPILVDMEMRGVRLNKHYQHCFGNRLFKDAAQLEASLNTACAVEIKKIQQRMAGVARSKRVTQKAKDRIVEGQHKEATFSWRSPKQVSDLIYKELRVPPRFWEKTEKGQLSVGSKARPRLMLNIGPKHKAYGVLESYEELYRAKDQYSKFVAGDSKAALNVVEHEGRIHGQFVQEPKTGRLSHQAPNMGNIPRGDSVKKLFVPDKGKVFWYFDYSQVEFRILAHLSQDPNMIEACKSDPHTMTAQLCGVDRATAKCVNGHSLIRTEEGLKRIKSTGPGTDGFSEAYFDEVELNGKLVPLKKSYYDGEKEQYLVITDKGLIAGTGVHRAMTQRGLVKLKDLTDSDRIEHTPLTIHRNCFIKNIKLSNNHYLRLDSNYAYFAGLFIGDGSASNNAANICTGHYGKYIEWREEASKAVKSVGYKGTITSTESKVVYVGSRKILGEMNKAGLVRDCLSKKQLQVPLWVIEGSDEIRNQFLAGLIDTDGSVTKKGGIEICSKAWELIQDLCILATDMGIPFYVSPSFNKTYKKWYYKFCISSAYTGFLKKYLRCKWKVERLKEKQYKTPRERTGKVKIVIPIGKQKSYDLEVDTQEHLYSVNGFTTHNTINFAFLYGAMAKKAQMIFLMQAGQWKSLEECNELRARFFAGYNQLMPYLEKVKKVVRTYGFSATPTGYVRRFPEVFDAQNKWDVMACERKGVNLLGQGFGASIMKRAMINLYQAGYTMVSQVHDSAIGMLDRNDDLEEHKKTIELIAQSAYTLRVPLVAEVKFLNSFAEGDIYQTNTEKEENEPTKNANVR